MHPLKLMCIFAHPDDESMGMGSTLAKYAAEGIETYLITATGGERGWQGPAEANPGFAALRAIRAAELMAAAERLGIREVRQLGYLDGDLDAADWGEATQRIVTHIRRVQPQVVVTFPPDGAYGHPDHIAISQLTAGAIVCAADATYADLDGRPPHRVSKLYYMVDSQAQMDSFIAVLGDICMLVDGVARGAVAWALWTITTWIDGTQYRRVALDAIACHRSQLPDSLAWERLPETRDADFIGRRGYYRVFSVVNGGRRVENDLFEGLRGPVQHQEG